MADESADRSPAVRRALWLSIWDGIFANLYANLTGGVFLVGCSPKVMLLTSEEKTHEHCIPERRDHPLF